MEEVTIFLSDIFHSSVKFNIVISILFSYNCVVGLSYSTDHQQSNQLHKYGRKYNL